MATKTFPLPVRSTLSRTNLSAELRAMWAVAWKEWYYTVRYPSWFVSMIIWPIIFPMIYLLTGFALAGPDGSGLAVFQKATGISDFIGYIGVGTTIWMWQNITLWSVGQTIREEQLRGTLESNWIAPTWRFSFIIGNSLTQLVTMLMFLLVTYLEFSLLLGMRVEGNLLLILLIVFISVPSIYGLGMTFASLVVYAKEAGTFVFLVRGLVMVFCGITFPISILPAWMQAVSAWLPPTYVIHALRAALLSNATFAELLPDIYALIGFGAFWMVFGFVTFNFMERRARKTGALGQY